MAKPKLVAKAVLLREDGTCLILTRSDTDKVRPGELDFAGGRIEEQENYEAAVIREIEEEAGILLTKDDVTLVFTDTSFYQNLTTIRFLYAAVVKDPIDIRLSSEHSTFQWLGLREIEKTFSHPVWVKGLRYAVDHDLLPVQVAP